MTVEKCRRLFYNQINQIYAKMEHKNINTRSYDLGYLSAMVLDMVEGEKEKNYKNPYSSEKDRRSFDLGFEDYNKNKEDKNVVQYDVYRKIKSGFNYQMEFLGVASGKTPQEAITKIKKMYKDKARGTIMMYPCGSLEQFVGGLY